MEELNADTTFVEMTVDLQKEWDPLSKERKLKIPTSKIIVDGVFVFNYGHRA